MKRYEKSLPVIGFGIDRDQIDAFSVSQSKHQSEKQIAIYVVGVGGVFFVYVFIRFENSGERKVNTHLERKKNRNVMGDSQRTIERDGDKEKRNKGMWKIQRSVMFMTFLYLPFAS